jgi:hypothetical protein
VIVLTKRVAVKTVFGTKSIANARETPSVTSCVRLALSSSTTANANVTLSALNRRKNASVVLGSTSINQLASVNVDPVVRIKTNH